MKKKSLETKLKQNIEIINISVNPKKVRFDKKVFEKDAKRVRATFEDDDQLRQGLHL